MNKKQILLIAAPLLVLPLIGFLYYTIFLFHITGITPKTTKVSSLSPFIDVHFNKEIREEGIALSVTESPITGHKIIDKKTLRIGLDSLTIGQEYKIEIYEIYSTNGDKLTDKKISFVAKDIPFDELPSAQANEILKAQDTPSGAKADPILSYLPHDELNYRLQAISGDDNLVIDAEILLSAADVKIDRNAAIEQAKQDIQEYIRSVSLNPDAYAIRYTVVEPVLTKLAC